MAWELRYLSLRTRIANRLRDRNFECSPFYDSSYIVPELLLEMVIKKIVTSQPDFNLVVYRLLLSNLSECKKLLANKQEFFWAETRGDKIKVVQTN